MTVLLGVRRAQLPARSPANRL